MIPKTLAVNAAKDSTDLVAKLRAYHNAAQTARSDDPKRELRFYGLDLYEGTVRDNLKAGVLEPTMSKTRSLKSALEAATSLLRSVANFIWNCRAHRLAVELTTQSRYLLSDTIEKILTTTEIVFAFAPHHPTTCILLLEMS